MTDNEIVKALECCVNNKCALCKRWGTPNCMIVLYKDALALINRQKAELDKYAQEQHALMIEKDELFDIAEKQKVELADEKAKVEICAEVIARQDKEIEHHKKTIAQNAQLALDVTVDELQKAKADAVREFVEKLKTTVTYHEDECGEFVPWVDFRDIDNLVKEFCK